METETVRRAGRRHDPTGTPANDAAAREDVQRLWEEHGLGLVRLAAVVLGGREGAEDAVQDAFVGLYKNYGRLRDTDGALAYVRTAVLNKARSVLRRRRLPSFFAATYERPTGSAETYALLSAERQVVMNALERLPRRQREALVLRYYSDLSERETAEAMGVSRGTVKSTTSRGLSTLGRMLEEER